VVFQETCAKTVPLAFLLLASISSRLALLFGHYWPPGIHAMNPSLTISLNPRIGKPVFVPDLPVGVSGGMQKRKFFKPQSAVGKFILEGRIKGEETGCHDTTVSLEVVELQKVLGGRRIRVSPHTQYRGHAYLTVMKNRIIINSVAMSALALSFLLVGCDREVSSEKSTSVSSDGTVKSKEKTVTQSPDGTVTKTEESKKTTPPEKP